MKINVSVDLSDFYAGDEYNGMSIEDAIIDAVSAKVLSETEKRINKRIDEIVNKEMEKQVADAVKTITVEAL